MKMCMMRKMMTLMPAFAAIAAFAATIEVEQDRADALYRTGDEATFAVTVKGDDGAPLKSGTATWSLDNFGSKKFASGNTDLAESNPFKVKGRMDEEGFLRLQVRSGTNSVVWGVGYDVEKIRQNEPRPADFDEYWTSEKARLEREVPLDPKMTLDERLSTKTYNCYRVNFATFGGKRVYGFMAVPKDSSKAPFRVRVNVPGAGPGAVSAGTGDDEIHLVMNVHTFDPKATHEEQKAQMQLQNAALAEKYGLPERNAYSCSIAGIGESREDYWYHDVMLGINRAVDWVCARPDVDLSQVTYFGSSQGGGFGLFLSYLNSHFTKSFVAVCAITGHYGYRQKRMNGWPNLIARQSADKRAAAERYAAYFDGVNFAYGIKSPIRFIVGFADMACAPADVYAAYNVCRSKDKGIINAIGSGHNWYPWHSQNAKKPGGFNFDVWLRTK